MSAPTLVAVEQTALALCVALTKRCPRCGLVKSTSEFYKNRASKDGLRCRCKPCMNACSREYNELHPDRIAEKRQRYSERHHEKILARGRAWEAENRLARRAHGIVHRAVASGVLIRPPACSKCGRLGKVQAHHHDYALPLEVAWLCARCHQRLHSGTPGLTT